MPGFQDRNQTQSEEQFEAPMTGPFGGIQSELPPTEIEGISGVISSTNFLFQKGAAYVRYGLTPLQAMPTPAENTLGIWYFFDNTGQLHRGIFTATRVLQYIGPGWAQITGTPALSGTVNQLFSWSILNYQLCFSQGSNSLLLWNGSGTYSSPAGAPSGVQYMAEIGLHLMVTTPALPNRYTWSGIGDPTDWTSFTSGLNDVVNDFGPIRGLIKLGQYGYGFHNYGIMQIVPTGIGVAPFAFYPIASGLNCLIAPFTLAKVNFQGRDLAVYVGMDNVYLFDGSSVEPIGDHPLGDGRRMGARTLILKDIASANAYQTSGYVSYGIGQQPYKAYWLTVPGVSQWVYNFDEGNWTQFTYGSPSPFVMGNFPSTIFPTVNPLLGGGSSSGLLSFVDTNAVCDQQAILQSGRLIFKDRRHKHTIKKVRISFIDLPPGSNLTQFSLFLQNEAGQNQTFTIPPTGTIGTGSGDVWNYVQEFNLSGLRFFYQIIVPPGVQTAIVEVAPMYEEGGEQRGGQVEN